jgi:hypothetical protein
LGGFGITSRRRTDDELTAVHAELEELRDENARLQLERQRLASTADAADTLRDRLRTLERAADSADEAWHVLAGSAVLRDTLLGVIGDLERTLRVARHQLLSDTPVTELDRRTEDRRRSSLTIELQTAVEAGERRGATNGNGTTHANGNGVAHTNGNGVARTNGNGHHGPHRLQEPILLVEAHATLDADDHTS